jgi:nucleoside-specific outer membrane channel protein Tsx
MDLCCKKLPKTYRSFAVALLGLCSFSQVHAGAATFSTTNVQYLVGHNYELGDSTRSIITLEHADIWKYGDNFFFVDITNPNRTGTQTPTSYYSELSPRLSLGKIFSGQEWSYGPIKDVLFTSTAELPDSRDAKRTYLYGVAVDFKIPGFVLAQVNYYARNSMDSNIKTGQQVTLVWLVPFSVGVVDFVFEGFLDYAYDVAPQKNNLLTQPRFLVDIGKLFSSAGNLYAGMEYDYWRNKFGIDGVTERCPQAMVKWVF